MDKSILKSIKKNSLQVFSIIIIFLLCLLFSRSNISTIIENKLYDSYLSITAGSVKPSDRIVLVLLDQQSLDWAKENRGWSWPWPRAAYSEILEFFAHGKATAVCFDVLFSESSVYGEQDDQAFAEAGLKYNNAIHAFHFSSSNGVFEIETEPLKVIQDSAALCASVMSVTDSDGVVRRARLGVDYQGEFYPTLGVAPLFKEQGFSNKTASASKLVEKASIPVLKDGTIFLRYQSEINKYIPYNAAQILQSLEAIKNGSEPLLSYELFEDSVIFFGFYAPGLFDLVSTPLQKNYPGVGVHVTLLDTILNQAFIREVPAYIQIALLFVAILLVTISISDVQSKKNIKHARFLFARILSLFLFSLVFFFCLSLSLFYFGFYLKNASILLGVAVAFFVSVLMFYIVEGKQRRYLKKAFGQYVSTAVVDELISNPEKLQLGGERRELTMFFSDLQGFTSISENLEPQELTALLNDFLSLMSDVILSSGGTIDKYEGDAIIAFWNAPLETKAHPYVALKAALECQRLLSENEKAFSERAKGRPFKMRIGINTGVAVVGNMGSKHRFDYTMLGDAVNLSSRLEGINKLFGTYTLCSEATKLLCEKESDAIKFREIGRVAVVGKDKAVTVYEPLTIEAYQGQAHTIEAFNAALNLFYQGKLNEAYVCFSKLKDQDTVALHYESLCRTYLETNRALTDGVIKATEK